MRVDQVLWQCDYCDRAVRTRRHELPKAGWFWVPAGVEGVSHACDECAPVLPEPRRLGSTTIVKDLRCPELRATGQCQSARGHDGGHRFP